MAEARNNPHNDDRPEGSDATARNMSSEELLSAYLDGECTADEQADIEAQMVANPELRQLADELRAVRASLELLPQYRLPVQFAESVQRRAEREVLTGNGEPSHGGVTVGAGNAVAPPSPQVIVPGDRQGWARPYLWTLAALAAAIVILVTNREPVERTEIASGPQPSRGVEPDKLAADSGVKSSVAVKSERRNELADSPSADAPVAASDESKSDAKEISPRNYAEGVLDAKADRAPESCYGRGAVGA
jgi:hypothetical protein